MTTYRDGHRAISAETRPDFLTGKPRLSFTTFEVDDMGDETLLERVSLNLDDATAFILEALELITGIELADKVAPLITNGRWPA